MAKRSVCLTIETNNDQDFVDAFERLSRMAAGEILAGKEARVWAMDPEEEE
jgi:hypothetical protein